MSGEWIGGRAAIHYLLANMPMDDAREATLFFEEKVRDGTLPARDKGVVIPPAQAIDWGTWFEVRRADVERLCGKARSAAGRKPDDRWEDFWIELAASIYEDGIPATQAELEQRMLQWFGDTFGDPPSLSSVRPRIARLLARLGQK